MNKIEILKLKLLPLSNDLIKKLLKYWESKDISLT